MPRVAIIAICSLVLVDCVDTVTIEVDVPAGSNILLVATEQEGTLSSLTGFQVREAGNTFAWAIEEGFELSMFFYEQTFQQLQLEEGDLTKRIVKPEACGARPIPPAVLELRGSIVDGEFRRENQHTELIQSLRIEGIDYGRCAAAGGCADQRDGVWFCRPDCPAPAAPEPPEEPTPPEAPEDASFELETCVEDDQAHFLDNSGCESLSACTGDWTVPPTHTDVLYVQAGTSTGGDGSRTLPFASIGEALKHAQPDALIALRGAFDEPLQIDQPVTLWGACPSETVLSQTASVTDEVTIGNLRLAALIVEPTATASVTQVIVGPGDHCIEVREGATLYGNRLKATGCKNGVFAFSATVDLSDAFFERNEDHGIWTVSSTVAVRRMVSSGTPVLEKLDYGVFEFWNSRVQAERLVCDAAYGPCFKADSSISTVEDLVAQGLETSSVTVYAGLAVVAGETFVKRARLTGALSAGLNLRVPQSAVLEDIEIEGLVYGALIEEPATPIELHRIQVTLSGDFGTDCIHLLRGGMRISDLTGETANRGIYSNDPTERERMDRADVFGQRINVIEPTGQGIRLVEHVSGEFEDVTITDAHEDGIHINTGVRVSGIVETSSLKRIAVKGSQLNGINHLSTTLQMEDVLIEGSGRVAIHSAPLLDLETTLTLTRFLLDDNPIGILYKEAAVSATAGTINTGIAITSYPCGRFDPKLFYLNKMNTEQSVFVSLD